MRFRRHRNGHSSIECRQLVEMVTDYLEGDLDPVDHASIEHHLSFCDDCPAYVRQVRVMLELTRSLGSGEEVPAAFVDELAARFRRHHGPR
jgi:predicted anti-sigma-YlaC factor YlaD